MAVQSKWTINHFDGLNANDCVNSTPFIKWRYSGQINALPAYAASTCIQIFSLSPKIKILLSVVVTILILTHKLDQVQRDYRTHKLLSCPMSHKARKRNRKISFVLAHAICHLHRMESIHFPYPLQWLVSMHFHVDKVFHHLERDLI
mgnify:CR=1 FL=1